MGLAAGLAARGMAERKGQKRRLGQVPEPLWSGAGVLASEDRAWRFHSKHQLSISHSLLPSPPLQACPPPPRAGTALRGAPQFCRGGGCRLGGFTMAARGRAGSQTPARGLSDRRMGRPLAVRFQQGDPAC